MRGRQFFVNGRFPGRPTMDMTREGLFNILVHGVGLDGCRFLDLYSGSGSVGFEAYSRGASQVVCVEQDRRLVQAMKSNAQTLGIGGLTVVCSDVGRYLSRFSDGAAVVPFDVIYADPPYESEDVASLPGMIFRSGLLAPDGVLVIEHAVHFPGFPEPHRPSRTQRYGRSALSFFPLS